MNTRFLQLASLLSALTFAVGCGSPVAEQNQTEPAPTVVLANTVCPIMGDAVNEELTTIWNGKTIGFCCAECLPEWNKLSDDEKSEKLASAGTESHGDHDHGEHTHDDHDDHKDTDTDTDADHQEQGESQKELGTG